MTKVIGTASDDILNGSISADVLSGLSGNDTLIGDAGTISSMAAPVPTS